MYWWNYLDSIGDVIQIVSEEDRRGKGRGSPDAAAFQPICHAWLPAGHTASGEHVKEKSIPHEKCLTSQRQLGIYTLTEGADTKLTKTNAIGLLPNRCPLCSFPRTSFPILPAHLIFCLRHSLRSRIPFSFSPQPLPSLHKPGASPNSGGILTTILPLRMTFLHCGDAGPQQTSE